MRLEEITFHRVGLWSELAPLRLGARLTLVLGDNEAGKTTAKRALEALLFGPSRALVAPLSSEGLFHASAVARLPGGETLRWTRRGRAVEPEGAADALACALPAEWGTRFRDLFRLGHAEVRADESTFLSESGALGRMLFAASAGINAGALAAAEERLQRRLKEAESGAQGTDGLKLRLTALKERREAMARGPRFADCDERHGRLEAVRAKVKATSEQLSTLGERHRRLLAWARGLPEHRKLRAAELRLQALHADGPTPSPAWVKRLVPARQRRETAERALQDAAARRASADAELLALPAASSLALFADEVERMAARGVEAARELKELASSAGELRTLTRELATLLARFGVDADEGALLSAADALILPEARRRQLTALAAEGDGTGRALEGAAAALRDAERALKAAEGTQDNT
ncbi:MAG: AAA family ATPase [Myxococcales bacterium]